MGDCGAGGQLNVFSHLGPAAEAGPSHQRRGSFSESLDVLAQKLGLSGPMGPAGRPQQLPGQGPLFQNASNTSSQVRHTAPPRRHCCSTGRALPPFASRRSIPLPGQSTPPLPPPRPREIDYAQLCGASWASSSRSLLKHLPDCSRNSLVSETGTVILLSGSLLICMF